MVVRRYETPQVFLAIYEEMMLEHESVSQLILYNAYQKLAMPVCDTCSFGAVLKNEEPMLLFCNVEPYNLVIQVIDDRCIGSSTAELVNYIFENAIHIEGVNARNDVCQKFIDEFTKKISCTFVEKLSMDIMEIREVKEVGLVEGKQRFATLEEARMIADWMIQYQMETMTSEIDYEYALNRAKRLINAGKVFLFVDEMEVPVSMAIIARELINGIAIGYVYTPENYRGKAYAAANIYYLSKMCLEQGINFCTLFADKKNPVSSRAYEKVGFQIVEDHYEYKIVMNE